MALIWITGRWVYFAIWAACLLWCFFISRCEPADLKVYKMKTDKNSSVTDSYLHFRDISQVKPPISVCLMTQKCLSMAGYIEVDVWHLYVAETKIVSAKERCLLQQIKCLVFVSCYTLCTTAVPAYEGFKCLWQVIECICTARFVCCCYHMFAYGRLYNVYIGIFTLLLS